jgi:cysteine-rich repeat protein
MRSTGFMTIASFSLLVACASKKTNDPGIDASNTDAVCGNSAVEAPEECDDGNITDGDGCSATCTDEAAAITGLLQKCGQQGLPNCPANASECIALQQGGTAYCTPKCVVGGTGTGAANGMSNVQPPPNVGTCNAAYTGAIGTPQCAVLLPGFVPADAQLVVGRNYTNVDFGCAVVCGANQTCPPSTTCNAGIGVCLPQ